MTGVSERLDAIEARKNAATPGPWKLWGMAVMADPVGNSNLDDAKMIAKTHDPDRVLRTWNAQFIAHAPQDITDLLDLARKQQAAIDAVRALMGELSAREDRWKAAYEEGDMTHAEASSAALEDRWVYAQLAELLFPLNALEGK